MKFLTHNVENINISDTSLMGYIECDYQTLKKLFGNPHNSDNYKTEAQWDILLTTEKNKVVSIYNWKDGKKFLGKEGTPKTKITKWNVACNSNELFDIIEELIKNAK